MQYGHPSLLPLSLLLTALQPQWLLSCSLNTLSTSGPLHLVFSAWQSLLPVIHMVHSLTFFRVLLKYHLPSLDCLDTLIKIATFLNPWISSHSWPPSIWFTFLNLWCSLSVSPYLSSMRTGIYLFPSLLQPQGQQHCWHADMAQRVIWEMNKRRNLSLLLVCLRHWTLLILF